MDAADYAGIALIITTIGTFITALTGMGAMLFTWRTHATVVVAAKNIKKIELETNSMHNEIVAVTRSDAMQMGVAEGRALQKADKGE